MILEMGGGGRFGQILGTETWHICTFPLFMSLLFCFFLIYGFFGGGGGGEVGNEAQHPATVYL